MEEKGWVHSAPLLVPKKCPAPKDTEVCPTRRAKETHRELLPMCTSKCSAATDSTNSRIVVAHLHALRDGKGEGHLLKNLALRTDN